MVRHIVHLHKYINSMAANKALNFIYLFLFLLPYIRMNANSETVPQGGNSVVEEDKGVVDDDQGVVDDGQGVVDDDQGVIDDGQGVPEECNSALETRLILMHLLLAEPDRLIVRNLDKHCELTKQKRPEKNNSVLEGDNDEEDKGDSEERNSVSEVKLAIKNLFTAEPDHPKVKEIIERFISQLAKEQHPGMVRNSVVEGDNGAQGEQGISEELDGVSEVNLSKKNLLTAEPDHLKVREIIERFISQLAKEQHPGMVRNSVVEGDNGAQGEQGISEERDGVSEVKLAIKNLLSAEPDHPKVREIIERFISQLSKVQVPEKGENKFKRFLIRFKRLFKGTKRESSSSQTQNTTIQNGPPPEVPLRTDGPLLPSSYVRDHNINFRTKPHSTSMMLVTMLAVIVGLVAFYLALVSDVPYWGSCIFCSVSLAALFVVRQINKGQWVF